MTDIKQLKVATIVPGPQKDGNAFHLAQGTRVLLSDGSELGGVTSVALRADTGGVWVATIEVLPERVPTITAAADVRVVDVTGLADDSRKYAAVEAD